MNISCNVIRDLLPLYHDQVCSEDSRRLVEEHLKACPACQKELDSYDKESVQSDNLEEAKMIQNTARIWEKNRLASFLKGAMIVSFLACFSCIAAFNLIGSYIADDGTLVEPFGFIPIAWLFALLGIILAVGYAFARRIGKGRRNTK